MSWYFILIPEQVALIHLISSSLISRNVIESFIKLSYFLCFSGSKFSCVNMETDSDLQEETNNKCNPHKIENCERDSHFQRYVVLFRSILLYLDPYEAITFPNR